jgi:type IV conjugative transfer system protein TraL
MSVNPHVILNHVDSPVKVLLWTRSELALYVSPAICGLFLDQLVSGIIVSGINVWLNRHYKKRFGKGQFQAVMYWFLPTTWRIKKLPPSYIREYLG